MKASGWPFRPRGNRILFIERGGGHRLMRDVFSTPPRNLGRFALVARSRKQAQRRNRSPETARWFAQRYNAAYLASLRDRARIDDPEAPALLRQLVDGEMVHKTPRAARTRVLPHHSWPPPAHIASREEN